MTCPLLLAYREAFRPGEHPLINAVGPVPFATAGLADKAEHWRLMHDHIAIGRREGLR